MSIAQLVLPGFDYINEIGYCVFFCVWLLSRFIPCVSSLTALGMVGSFSLWCGTALHDYTTIDLPIFF